MGRLIKYELKKQQTSRNIILALLGVFLLVFAVGIFTDNGNMVGISVVLELFFGMFVFFYMSIESLLILNRDLKTKQSHMLWMVPMPSWKILGAKYIAAILQIFFISVAYALAGVLCILSMIAKADVWKEFFEGLRTVGEWVMQGHIQITDIATLLAMLLLMFLGWTSVIATGFLAVIISRTVLINSRFAGIVSFILFFVINGVIEYIYHFFQEYAIMGIHEGVYIGIAEYIFFIITNVILFVVSSVLAEKKLSV
ncbi:MAG: hypothetical protein Q4B39_02390 [[Ruminococcus] gnavus]|nr:hypothetical protein [Mediterraneibacter gnavus]